jgi:hypothetical protein
VVEDTCEDYREIQLAAIQDGMAAGNSSMSGLRQRRLGGRSRAQALDKSSNRERRFRGSCLLNQRNDRATDHGCIRILTHRRDVRGM